MNGLVQEEFIEFGEEAETKKKVVKDQKFRHESAVNIQF